MTQLKVNADNFRQAETHRMMADLQRDAGGVNLFSHNREPAAVDEQTVIRMNRDTLYSFAVVDLSEGATLTVPDAGERYLSVMVVNEDHYINRVLHDPGSYALTVEEFDTPYVVVAARILVDPADPDDLAAVAAIQDRFALEATAGRTFGRPATTPRASIGPATRCCPWRPTSTPSPACSDAARRSTRSTT